MKKILLFALTLLFTQTLFGQSFPATYNFGSVNSTSGKTDPTPVPVLTGLTLSPFTANGTVSVNPNAAGRFSFTNQPLGATDALNTFTGSIDLTKYYEVTITPNAPNTLSLTSISFVLQRSGTGIRQYAVRSSLDGFTANLPASINPANANLTVVPTNIFQVSDASTTAQNGSRITLNGFTALSAPVTFRFYGFNAEMTGGTFSMDDVVFAGSVSSGSDTAPPVTSLNFPKANNITSASIDLSNNISENGRSYYILIPANGDAPVSSAQIKAGVDGNNTPAFKFGSFTNVANTDANITITGLSSSTSYKIYVVAEDGIPNLQTNFTTLSASTLAVVDNTPPATSLNYPKITNVSSVSADFTNNISEAGKTYYVLIPASGTAPTTTTQVKAGLDGNNNTAYKSGTITNAANVDATVTITGLTALTAYRIYGVAEDNEAFPNLQSTISISALNTSDLPNIIITQYYEGASVNKWIELTNLSNAAVNTASPQLKLALYNISGDAGNISITGAPSQVFNLNVTIPARGTILIGNTGNGNEVPYLTAASAATTSNAVVNFNGNDGIALLDANNNVIDAFGQGVNAKDVSYVRSINVTAPSASFVVDDWLRLPLADVQNAIDGDDQNQLGVHFPPNLPVCAAPSAPATGLLFNNVTTGNISASFTKSPDANEYLIIRSQNNTLSILPVDGTSYTVGAAFGGGIIANRIVGNSFTDNALASSTKYYYFIIPLNNLSCTGGPKYLNTNILTASQSTNALLPCTTPAAQATNFTVTSSNYNFVQAAFNTVSGVDEYLVVMSTTSTLTASPINQTVYNVGDQLGGGIVVKRGTGGTFIRNGLTQNTNYFFFIFSINSSCSGGPLYLIQQPLTGIHKTGILDVNKLNFYFGNLHSHSSYSDGNKDDNTKKPEDDYAFAKTAMNLDFLGISEHNHTQAGMSIANWQPGIDAAKKATTSNFVALHGMEWGVISGGGHVIVYGIDSLIGWEPGENQIYVPKSVYTGPTGLFRIINRHGLNAVATLAHPNTTDYNNISATYDLSADSAIVGSALESGPAFSTNTTYSDPASSMNYLSYYNRMLAKGYHLGATIDHDNHNLTFGKHTRARLVVLAPTLTENDLLDAIKKMRFYASEDSAAKVTFSINKQPVGSIFKAAGVPEISVNAITTSTVTSIKILYGTPGSGTNPVPIATGSSGTLTYTHTTLANLATGYYYADLTEADGSRIITSPVWFTRDDATVKKNQNITFVPTKTVIYGDPDFPVAATSDNTSINITYTSSDPNVATISNNDLHIVNAGMVTITANQIGDNFYNPATPKQMILTVSPRPYNIVADGKTKLEGTVDPTLTYTTNSTLVGTDKLTGSLVRDAGETSGDYLIKQGTLNITPNYAINFITANFHITALPIARIAGTTSVCINASAPTITFTATAGTAPFIFTYTINGSSNRSVSSNTNTATISVPTNLVGMFNYALVNVSDVNASQPQTGSAIITINPLPIVNISSNKGFSISKGEAIILTASGGSQYNWSGSEIISGQNTANLTIRPKQSGTYRVVVANTNGCSIDQSITITVIDDYKLEGSTVVTPNGDGINDKFIIKNIDYYPNNTLKIFDKAGRVLYTKHTYNNDWDGTINGSPLAEGTYYYILDLGSKLGNFKGFINIIRD